MISTNQKRLEVLLLCLLLGCYLLPWRMYGREPVDKAPGTSAALHWQEVSGLRMTFDLGRVAIDHWRVADFREGEGVVRARPGDAWANTLAALTHLLPVLLGIVALPETILLRRRPTVTLVITGLVLFCAANFVLALLPGVIFRGGSPPGRVAEHAAVWWLGPLLCLLLAGGLLYLWWKPLVQRDS
jgi:hypothetical protein